jgi:hypothetical protein
MTSGRPMLDAVLFRPYRDAAAVKDRGGAVSAKSGEIPALSRNGGPLRG